MHAATLQAHWPRARSAGRPHAEQAAVLPTHAHPPGWSASHYRTYTTRDATIAVACVSPGLQRAMMRAVGLTDPAHERPLADRAAQVRHYQDLGARMEALMASRSTADWKAAFDAHGVPAAGVKLPIELLDDEQVLANRMVHDVDHPAIGPVRVLANPVRLDGDGFVPAPSRRPSARRCVISSVPPASRSPRSIRSSPMA